MSLVIPKEAIAKHWRGALESRVRRAPLEHFLRRHAAPPAPSGVAQITDNLCRATVLLMEACLGDASDEFTFTELRDRALGPIACAVSAGLATRIQEENAWRIAALVSVCQLHAARLGFSAASRCAADIVQEYFASYRQQRPSDSLSRIALAAAEVLDSNDLQELKQLMLRHVMSLPEAPLPSIPALPVAAGGLVLLPRR